MRRYGDRGHCPSDLERARYVARVATGVLMLFGGALFNAANLLVSEDYASFADQAHFDWVTAAWRAAVAPNVFCFISLLMVFEAVVDVLILSGDEDPSWHCWCNRLPSGHVLVRLGRDHLRPHHGAGARRRYSVPNDGPPPSLPPPSPRQRLPISMAGRKPTERMVA